MKQSNNAIVNRYQTLMDIVKELSNAHIHIQVAIQIKYALRIYLVNKKYYKNRKIVKLVSYR